MQRVRNSRWNLIPPRAKLVTKQEDDASGTTRRLDRYKRVVNVVNMVNMVNVAERVMSYVTPNPAGHMPKRLWAFWDDRDGSGGYAGDRTAHL
jgi:hypothetical protein